MTNKLEICCYTVESAVLSEKAGADRIELCDNFLEGGTTPSYASVDYLIKNLSIPLHVMIRPRGGDFLYNTLEFEIMKNEVVGMKKLGVQGIVFGILTASGEIDTDHTQEILELAGSMDQTFHRAFDMCKDHLGSLEKLKQLGVNRVLTSGGKNTAYEGIRLLSKLVEASEDQLSVMPGSGVNENTIAEIVRRTRATEFHATAKTFVNSQMDYRDPEINMGKFGNIYDHKKISVDTNQINAINTIIKK